MNRRFFYLFSAFFISISLLSCSEPEYRTLEGDSGKYRDFRGSWLLVNYWAEWCAPCIEEMPELNEIAKRPDVNVLAVNFDGVAGDKLNAAVKKIGVKIPSLITNPIPYLHIPKPSSLPATYVINPEGKLTATLLGAQTQSSLLTAIKSSDQAQ